MDEVCFQNVLKETCLSCFTIWSSRKLDHAMIRCDDLRLRCSRAHLSSAHFSSAHLSSENLYNSLLSSKHLFVAHSSLRIC